MADLIEQMTQTYIYKVWPGPIAGSIEDDGEDLIAKNNDGWLFKKWSDGSTQPTHSREIYGESDLLYAIFEKDPNSVCCNDSIFSNKDITMKLFRVSRDSLFLDIMFEIPEGFYANSFLLEVRYLKEGNIVSQKYDLSYSLFYNSSDSDLSKLLLKNWTLRLPLSKLPIFQEHVGAAIYIGHITASYLYDQYGFPLPFLAADELAKFTYFIDKNGQVCKYLNNDDLVPVKWSNESDKTVIAIPDNCNTQPLESNPVCSDINLAYKCMLDAILTLPCSCDVVSDEVIRNYLILYGHLEALAAGDFETAETYFKLISQCFNKCPTVATRSNNKSRCNCGK